MTTWTDNTIDGLIRRLKNCRNVSDFVFLSAFPAREMPNPIQKYTVAAAHSDVYVGKSFLGERVGEGLKGRLYHAVLTLNVYAPTGSSGFALLRATALLADAIETADADNVIDDVRLGEIRYDSAARTYVREIKATLSLLMSEVAEDD